MAAERCGSRNQYGLCLGRDGHKGPHWNGTHPVTRCTWNDDHAEADGQEADQ